MFLPNFVRWRMMVPMMIITMNTSRLMLIKAIGLIFTHSPSTYFLKYHFQPASASIIGWETEIDSRLMREQTPRARKLPARVVMKGGTFR